MPAIDPNATGKTRKAVRTVNKQRAKKVRSARRELARPPKPVMGPQVPVKRPTTQTDRPSAASVAGANQERKHVAKQVRAVQRKGGSLKKKERAMRDLAERGVLTRKFVSGLSERNRIEMDDARAAAKLNKAGDEQLRKAGLAPIEGRKRPTAKSLDKIPKATYKAGFGVDIPGLLLDNAGVLIEGVARDPIGVPTKTAKQAALSVAALPAATIDAVTDPIGTVKAAAKDYETRSDETYKEKLARVRKEGGFAEAADLAAVASLGSAGAGRVVLRKAPARAAKLHSGGAKVTPKKGGLIRYGVGTRIDARKARKYEKVALQTEKRAAAGRTHKTGVRMTKTGPRLTSKPIGLTALQNEALQANRAAGRVVAVVPRRSGRKIAKVVANARGKAVQGLKYDSTKGPFSELAKERFNLNKDEAAALWLGTEVGIRDADTARVMGQKLRNKMARGRGDYTPKGWERDMDVVQQIDRILENPEKHFTPNFAATMDRLREHAAAIAKDEPQFKEGTKENRRRAVQAYLLDLEQGGKIPDGFELNPAFAMYEKHAAEASPPFERKLTGEQTRKVAVALDPETRAAAAKAIARHEKKLGRKANSDEKRTIRREATRAAAQYDPSTKGISEKTFYHGTAARGLTPEQLDGAQTNIDSLFGQGIYLTNKPGIAHGYAASRSGRKSMYGKGTPKKAGVIYKTKVNPKRILDLETGADPRFIKVLRDVGYSIGHQGGNYNDPDPFIGDALNAALETRGATNVDIYDAFRNAVIEYAGDYGLSKGDLTENFIDLAGKLRQEGWDALTHVGGKRTGHKPHQVVIVLDPQDGYGTGRDNPITEFDDRVQGERGDAAPLDESRVPDPAPTSLTVRKYENVAKASVPPLRYADETDADFNARVDAAAREAGLADPTYFRSEKQQGLSKDFGAHVVGGSGPKSTGKAFEGKNLDKGIFDTSFDQFIRGYAHNVKATHNYPLIVKLDDKNRLRSFSPDTEPQGKELGALMNDVNQAEPRLRKDSVVFVNKGLFEKKLAEGDGSDPGDYDTPEDAMDASARDALKDAVVDGDPDPELLKTPGWVAWPKEALRELEAELTAGTAGGRSFDIAKGKASQAILLVANVPWLASSAVGETLVAGLASGGRALTPRNAIGTARMWKAMNHKQRMHVATELGLGATGSDTASIKMGSTTNAHLVNAARDLKDADFWHRPRVGKAPVSTIINPVKWMRAADQGKTNVTRLLYAHSQLTKKLSPEGTDALAGALTNMKQASDATDRLLPVFEKPSAEQLDYLMENPQILEQIGERTSNALGDWTTMTARERQWANRFVMFYPFVRYSTRLMLHTMPLDHPVVTALLAELGQLKAEEYREVFGDDDLPWNMGKVYFGKTGESESIDLSKINPVANSLVGMAARTGTSSTNVPGGVVGMLPPYFQWAIDQATGINSYKGRPLRFDGDTDPFWNKPGDISLENRGELLAAQIQGLFYPAREAMNAAHPGSQSDESSLLFPQAMTYKKSTEIEGNSQDAVIRRATARNAEANAALNAKNNGGIGDLLLGALDPKESRDAESARERAYIKKLKAAQAKTAAERKRYRDTHGGKNPPSKKKAKPFGASGGGGKLFGSK